ncbi:enoyl-CoA hydratase-related protein [Octadecabacter sp. 1_MG-2023]|uniref:enoyl-CoA hydratase-related protein n=1 Tax=unclassified Octadecabacter TaxID=196158 RepID=UPI001C097DD4|nr:MULTISPECIES: enoyl-CoA hydratase-related protein [unclassified Octadecabacter]MBU2993008.1 enoyl-CoA hydratase/isomerase family protein [Octadecabacter sp. B2R22]MDO6733540.1 enoyl-CoA hydratase-related protein [Octadecabacter sp. 1_MG-2023]
MAKLVRFRVLDGVAVVTLDAPPVNALSGAMRAGLWDVFTRINSNDDIKAGVLMAAGHLFSAGADIREFGGAVRDPSLRQLCDLIEGCAKPVVAAIQGQALGGGAELVLAAHYRLATPDARIGLPEVALGLVPGAGGTQRLPRLIGPERALQMMISTNSIDAGSAQRAGLVDGIVQGDLGSGAIAFAKGLIESGKGARPTRANRSHLRDGRAYQAAISKARTALVSNPLHAPHRVVECVEAAALLPFETAMALESDAFDRCLAHPQSLALRHVFMAERRIDDALIERDGVAFKPVVPIGKAVVLRLRKAMRTAAEALVKHGQSEAEIDAAMVAYGFRKGPFGGRDASVANDAISRRLIGALVVEGSHCVEEQAVQRPADIDALAVHGIGFPRRNGGPMRAAQSMGLIGVRSDLRDWAQESDIWAAPELLDAAIKDSKGFDALA